MPDRTRPIRKEICLNEQELSLIRHNTTDIFSQKLGSGENKILRTRELSLGCPSLYNGHFSSKTWHPFQKTFLAPDPPST